MLGTLTSTKPFRMFYIQTPPGHIFSPMRPLYNSNLHTQRKAKRRGTCLQNADLNPFGESGSDKAGLHLGRQWSREKIACHKT
jgi:hypothetical protein